MKVDVYRGSGKLTETTATDDDIRRAYTTIPCPSCNGSGKFWITDEDGQDCVECSTRGKLTIPL